MGNETKQPVTSPLHPASRRIELHRLAPNLHTLWRWLMMPCMRSKCHTWLPTTYDRAQHARPPATSSQAARRLLLAVGALTLHALQVAHNAPRALQAVADGLQRVQQGLPLRRGCKGLRGCVGLHTLRGVRPRVRPRSEAK